MSSMLRTAAFASAVALAMITTPVVRAHWLSPVVNNYVSNHTRIDSVHRRDYRPVTVNRHNDTRFTEIIEAGPHPRERVVITRPGDALRVLSIGVNCNRVAPGKPADDHAPFAREVALLLQKQGAPLYGKVSARVVTGPHSTRVGILDGLEWLRKSAGPNDVSVIFLSAHGGLNQENYFLAPAGVAGVHGPDWRKKVVWGQEIRETLLTIPGRKVLILNTCCSGGILEGPVVSVGLPDTDIICCTRAHEGFGPAFAMDNALVRGLKGAAVDRAGIVTVDSLAHYLRQQVQHVTHDKEHVTTSRLSNLPLAVS